MSRRRSIHEEQQAEAADGEDGQFALRPSRSARKRNAEALQKLGVRLIDLTPTQLRSLPLPEELREAVETARRLSFGPALARQRQFIGRLMRELDPEPIERALNALMHP